MAESLKNKFLNKYVIEQIAAHLARHSRSFDRDGFIEKSCDGLECMELKERTAHITSALHQFLPKDFETTADILFASLHTDGEKDIINRVIEDKGIAGWPVVPISIYVAEAGMDHFDLSMQLLKEMTKRFSSEFAIRFFLIEKPKRTLSVLHDWTKDENYHVRRLASEGSRPRLPWAIQLPAFIKDPAPVLPLLEKLRDDPELYVRRSVANNLNDITKDHPDIVLKIANDWKNTGKNTDWVIKRACRTLLKQGNREALSLFGFEELSLRNVSLTLEKPKISIGEDLHFTFSGEAVPGKTQKLRLEYVIDFVKANGKRSGKIFQISERDHFSGDIVIKRKHSFKNLSTRRHYPGKHKLSVIVNGRIKAEIEFMLVE